MDFEGISSSYPIPQGGRAASEKITSLFQPDMFLSSRYFDDRRANTLVEPEKRLMLAILEDAIDCFRENYSAPCGKSKLLFDETQEWVFCANDWVFGFDNICSFLGFNPEYIRKGLVRWEENKFHSNAAGPS
jgi:hypothetical protein